MIEYLIQNSILMGNIVAVVCIYFGMPYWVYVAIVGAVMQRGSFEYNFISCWYYECFYI